MGHFCSFPVGSLGNVLTGFLNLGYSYNHYKYIGFSKIKQVIFLGNKKNNRILWDFKKEYGS
jgi:hypothetical protein